VVDVAFGAQAHRRLLNEFRLVLAQRFGTRSPGGG
jgi:hypothetical protein